MSDSKVPDTDPAPSEGSATVPETPGRRIDVIADLSSPETHAQIVDTNASLDRLREAAKTAGIDPRIVEVIKVIHEARRQIDAVRPLIVDLEKILPASAVVAVELTIEGIDTADDEIKRVAF